MADASETTGAWETVTVFPPSRCSRLARGLLSFDREWSEERSDRSRDRERSRERRGGSRGHGDLPNEQGIANTPAETGSDPKIATDHAESDPDESGSGPKTATDLAEKPSESERDATDSGQKAATSHTGGQRPRRVPATTLSTA